MRLVPAMLALSAIASVVGCRDDRASTTSTTSHVVLADPTAADQSNAPRDLALTGDVRRALVADNRLSLRAKSLVVVVRDGVVILRGDVKDPADHDRVVARIVSVPGVVRLDDRTNLADDIHGERR